MTDHERRARRLRLVEELLLRPVQPTGALDVHAQQARDRQVDLLHLVEVELVAEAADAGRSRRRSAALGRARPGPPRRRGRARRRATESRSPRAVAVRTWPAFCGTHGPRTRIRGGGEARHVDSRPCAESSGTWAAAGAGRRGRGAAAAGVPRLRLRRGRAGRRRADRRATSGPASSPTSRRRSPTPRCPASTTGIGHTRWATHGAPNDVNAHPHLGPTRPGRAGAQRDHRELRPAARPSSRPPGHELLSETDTEVAAHLLEPRSLGGADLTTAMQRVCRRLEGAFTLVAVDAAGPRPRWSPPAATRRWWSGLGEGENFLASDVAAFIEHTREALELGQDQVVTITRDAVEVTDFDGAPAEGRRYHVDWDLSAAEKDGYDWFMRKEIYEQPRAVARLAARPARRSRARCSSTRCGSPTRSCATSTRSSSSPAAPRSTPGMVAKYAIEHWTRIPCEVELASEFRYRDPILDPRHPGRRDQPVRRDRRHPAGDPARPRRSARRCWRSATPTARRSRASPTR